LALTGGTYPMIPVRKPLTKVKALSLFKLISLAKKEGQIKGKLDMASLKSQKD